MENIFLFIVSADSSPVQLCQVTLGRSQCLELGDHPFKTSACLRGEGCPHGPMVKRSQYIRVKNPLHKHFAGMPMVGG